MSKARHRQRPSDGPAADHNTSLANIRLQIEYVGIDTVGAAVRQIRRHSPKKIGQMAASIRRLGCLSSLIIDRNGRLIDGHAVWAACREAGLREVPVVRLDHLTEAEVSAAKLALNAFTLKGEWDWSAVSAEFELIETAEVDFDLAITGFDTPKIDWIMAEAAAVSANDAADPDDEPVEPDDHPLVTQAGDLWRIGDHRLICGDARDPDLYARLMQGTKARMVFNDVPYNVLIAGFVSGLGKKKHANFAMASGEMSAAQFTDFQATVNARAIAHSMDGSVHFLCIDYRHLREMLDAGEAHYSQLLNVLVWNKQTGGMGSLYRMAHELIFVWKAGSGPHVNNIELGKHGRYRTNVLDYPGMAQFGRERQEALAVHPTVKPVALVYDLILDVSHRGDVVLDPFSGSGTTILAAHRAGRAGYAIEIDPAYIDASLARIEKRTGLGVVLDATGESFGEVRERRAAEAAAAGEEARHG